MTSQELLEDFYNWMRKETGIPTLTEDEILNFLWVNMSDGERKKLVCDWEKRTIDIIIKSLILVKNLSEDNNGKTTDA